MYQTLKWIPSAKSTHCLSVFELCSMQSNLPRQIEKWSWKKTQWTLTKNEMLNSEMHSWWTTKMQWRNEWKQTIIESSTKWQQKCKKIWQWTCTAIPRGIKAKLIHIYVCCSYLLFLVICNLLFGYSYG